MSKQSDIEWFVGKQQKYDSVVIGQSKASKEPNMGKERGMREKALRLLLDWAVECGFGYDNIPDEYEKYKDEIEGMGYKEGLIYIAEREVDNE